MESKYSQTSIFIILAVVIIAVIITAFISNQSKTESEIQKALSQIGSKASANSIQSNLYDCLETTSKDSLTIIGIQGGYYEPPEKYFDLGWTFIPYFYDKNTYLNPSTEKVEEELAKYIDDNLELCVNQIQDEITLTHDKSKTTAIIEERKVNFIVDSQISLKKELTTTIQLNRPIEIDSKLSEIIELADYITNEHRENPDTICISCLAEKAKEKNLQVEILEFDEQSSLVLIRDTNSDYVFEFLNRY